MLRTNTSNQPLKQIGSKDFKKMILAATCWLNERKAYVDSLNVFPVPDGDTGTNMYLTVLNAAKEVQKLESERVCEVADALQEGALMGARGNSGVILSQLFRGMARSLKNKKDMTALDLAKALQGASDMAYKAVMKPVEGTILTVARYVGKGAMDKAKTSEDLIEVFETAIEEGNIALKKTPEMLPVLKEAKVVDAGGQGYIVLLEGALRALKGQSVEEDLKVITTPKAEVGFERGEFQPAKGVPADIEFQYCTEFLIMSDQIPLDKVRAHLDKMGDSLLVVGAKGITKVHVHTNNPGTVLEYALTFGSLMKIKIENMIEQSQQREEKLAQAPTEVVPEPKVAKDSGPKKPFGIVAVTTGTGLTEIFESLGVDQVVTGGQSMNPSTQDIVDAVESINSDHVIILPNNKNIIFAAEQVKNISKKEIIVVPTRSIPQGISALMRVNPEQSVEEISAAMTQGAKEIKTGEITFAVRNSRINSIDIAEGDCLGILDGEIKVVEKDTDTTALNLLNEMVDEDAYLITIYYGSDVTEDEASELKAKIEDQFDDLDVEMYHGGQPLYKYLFSVE